MAATVAAVPPHGLLNMSVDRGLHESLRACFEFAAGRGSADVAEAFTGQSRRFETG
jgi:hypothetical protein